MRTASAVVVLALAFAPAALAQTTQTPPPSPPSTAAPAPPKPLPTVAPPGAPQIVGRALGLDEAVAIGLSTQPQIQARLFDYAAARHRVTQALAPMLPQITGTVSASRVSQTTLSTSPQTGITTPVQIDRQLSDTFLAQVSLSQLLFDFGKSLAAAEAQRKLSFVALENVELQRQLIALAIREAYTNINFSQRLAAVAQQSFERAQLNLRSARGFFDVGTRPKSDVVRAEVDVANARVDLIRAQNAERLARVALNTAMGIPADTPTVVVDNLVYQPLTIDRTQLIGRALAQRPEYKQVRLRVSEAEARARRAFRDFFPDVTGAGFYGASRFDMNEIWEVAVQLSWTLFDGGNRIARFREAKVNVEAAQSRVRASELDISREVEQAYITVSEASERIQAAQVAVASAQENFRLAQGRFDAGVGTILELTDAQLALTQAQNTEAQALADYRIAVVRLERALGQR